MSYAPQIAESLARIGCRLSMDAASYAPQTLESVARICAQHESHLTVRNAAKLAPQLAETLARVGGSHITLEI